MPSGPSTHVRTAYTWLFIEHSNHIIARHDKGSIERASAAYRSQSKKVVDLIECHGESLFDDYRLLFASYSQGEDMSWT